MWYGGASSIKERALSYGKLSRRCQVGLHWVEEVHSKCTIEFLILRQFRHRIGAGLISIVESCNGKGRSDGNCLLAGPCYCDTRRARPCLNCDRSTGRDLSITGDRERQKPVDKIKDKDWECWLQRQIGIVQVETQDAYAPVI